MVVALEQTPPVHSSITTGPSSSTRIVRRGVHVKRVHEFYNDTVNIRGRWDGEEGEGEEEVDMFVYVNPLCSPRPFLCHPLETWAQGFMQLGDLNSALVMSPPSMPGDINFISQKMQQPVASGQTVTLAINIGRGERPLMEELYDPRAARL